MARALGHKYGQMIGDLIEAAIAPLLKDFAVRHDLYLDQRGYRKARRGKKVAWQDMYGNVHDLDYVLERGGTPETIGQPVAFIESAWRRYTKHSRNKAQEIQGAILPLAETYKHTSPFIGAALAGVFTDGAIQQLRSRGFSILHFPYEAIVDAFRTVGLDAFYDEGTPEAEFQEKIDDWQSLSCVDKQLIVEHLIDSHSQAIAAFIGEMESSVTREIQFVRILPLHGSPVDCASAHEAIKFVLGYDGRDAQRPVAKYEVTIVYNNGDRIDAQFSTKQATVQFLRHYAPVGL